MPYVDDTFMVGMGVYTVLQDSDDKVFLLRRSNARWMNGYYSLPAGRVESGETFIEGAVREAYEEAGVQIVAEDLDLYAVINRQEDGKHPDWVDLFYVTRTWQGEAHIHEQDSFDYAGWFSLDDLPDNVIKNQRDALVELSKRKNSLVQKFINCVDDQAKRQVA